MIGTHLHQLRFSHFLTSLQWTETVVTEEKLLKLHKNMAMRLDSAYIEVGPQRVKAEWSRMGFLKYAKYINVEPAVFLFLFGSYLLDVPVR